MEFTRVADIKRRDFIIRELQRHCSPGAAILDIGCGTGIITHSIANAGFRVTGIDASEKSIDIARNSNQSSGAEFLVADVSRVGLMNNTYDAVICSEVLEHLAAPVQLAQLIAGLLKADAIVIVTVPNGWGPRELLVTRPIQAIQQNKGWLWQAVSRVKTLMGYRGITVQSAADDLKHLQFFTEYSLRQLAETSGFYIVKTQPSNFIEQVFPFSLVIRKSRFLQRIDCRIADLLPLPFTSGFMSVWKKQ